MHRAETAVARGATISLGASADLVEQAVAAGGQAALGPVAAPRPATPSRTRAQVREALGVGDAPVVLAVGRLHPQKDYPTLVAALAALQHREPRPVLLVVGDGPDEDRVRHLVVTRGIAAQMLGRRDDVADLLAAADVLALSSVWEARALVVQEAMQVGLPVVATAVGGIPELVGEDALLVPAGDASALAAALERVLDHPTEAAVRAQRGLLRAASWPDEGAVVDQVIGVYRDVHQRVRA